MDEPATFGQPMAGPPQVPTRLIPERNDSSIPAPVLRDVLDRTQRLVYFSAHVAAFGSSPDLASVNDIDKTVRSVATLRILPFAPGSFVIPAELDDVAEMVKRRDETRELRAASIVTTFRELMSRFTAKASDAAVTSPLGFIQTLEDLGKIVGQYASRIEYTPVTSDMTGSVAPVVVDRGFVSRAVEVHNVRRNRTENTAVTVEGLLAELNVVSRSLKLVVHDPNPRTVTGTFEQSLTEQLIRLLGEKVRLSGAGVYRSSRKVRSIVVTECIAADGSDDLFR